jgi:hypothetical protein
MSKQRFEHKHGDRLEPTAESKADDRPSKQCADGQGSHRGSTRHTCRALEVKDQGCNVLATLNPSQDKDQGLARGEQGAVAPLRAAMTSEKAEMTTLEHCAVRGMLVGGSAAGTAIACAAVVARREFIRVLCGVASVAAWPLPAGAEQTSPVIGFLSSASPDVYAHAVTAFRQGLNETGYVDGRNVVKRREEDVGTLSQTHAGAQQDVARSRQGHAARDGGQGRGPGRAFGGSRAYRK